jgi:hypothetical protein
VGKNLRRKGELRWRRWKRLSKLENGVERNG